MRLMMLPPVGRRAGESIGSAHRRFVIFSFLLALVVGFLLPGRVGAQGCCTPGTSPLGGLSGRALSPWSLEYGLAFDGYDLRQGYRGSTKVPDPGRRHSQVARFVAYTRLGLPARATLVLEVPYDYRMREFPVMTGAGEEEFKLSNRAFGDLSTTFLIRVLPRSTLAPWGVDLGAGMKWATGSVEREQDSLRLPVELQSGTGSNDPLVVATGYRLWSFGGMAVSSLVRFPQQGRNGYRYGTEGHAVGFGYATPGANWGVGPELRLRAARPDRFQDVKRINTGGWRLMGGPRAFVNWSSLRLGLEAAALWPIHQNLNGLQLGVDNQLLVSVHWPTQ